MKKYILIAIAFVGVFFMTSCEDFLTNESEGSYATDTYFQNDQQAIDAIDALYYRMVDEGMFGREIMWEQGAANDFVWGRTRGYPALATLSLTGSVGPLNDVWYRLNNVIARANWVVKQLLDKEAKTTLTDVEKRSLGEAYFMRGMCHFYMAYRYGTNKQGVPFCRYEDFPDGYNNEIPEQRATVMENYELIIEDLTSAENYLPTLSQYSDADFGRAHKASAAGYKAKAYAYWACWDKSQYANVITEVNKMMSQYGCDITDNEMDNFTSDASKWRNKECVFSIPSDGGQRYKYGGIEFPGVSMENHGWGYMNGWGQFKPSYDIFELLMEDDDDVQDASKGNIRKKNFVLEYNQEFYFFGNKMNYWSSQDVESGFQIAKYLEPFTHEDAINAGYIAFNGDYPVARINFPLMRFVDCLLLRAEAYLATGNTGGATSDINKVRNRVNLKSLDHTATWTDLYHERRAELCFEHSDHLYDIKRWAVGAPSSEIQALALKELTTHPRARHYADRTDPTSTFEVGEYLDYQNPKKVWADWKIVFPYRQEEIDRANGALKQNEGYD